MGGPRDDTAPLKRVMLRCRCGRRAAIRHERLATVATSRVVSVGVLLVLRVAMLLLMALGVVWVGWRSSRDKRYDEEPPPLLCWPDWSYAVCILYFAVRGRLQNTIDWGMKIYRVAVAKPQAARGGARAWRIVRLSVSPSDVSSVSLAGITAKITRRVEPTLHSCCVVLVALHQPRTAQELFLHPPTRRGVHSFASADQEERTDSKPRALITLTPLISHPQAGPEGTLVRCGPPPTVAANGSALEPPDSRYKAVPRTVPIFVLFLCPVIMAYC